MNPLSVKFLNWFASVIFSALTISPAFAQADMVHSDLPLWTDSEKLWPKGFVDEDDFGCYTTVRFGTWVIEYFPESDAPNAYTRSSDWLEIYNYGVMHCANGYRWADEREDLQNATAELGYLIELENVNTPRGERTLWLMQSGFRPGSSYLLLAKPPNAEMQNTFEVLPIDCPKKFIRTAGSISVFLTDYCSINDQKSIRRFMKKMSTLEPIGILKLVESVKIDNEN